MFSVIKLRRGLSLVELLMVVSIVAVLATVLLGAMGLVRERARKSRAGAVVASLTAAIESYAAEDPLHAYPLTALLYIPSASPPPAYEIARNAVSGLPEGLIGVLEDRRLMTHDGAGTAADGRLLDPWGEPYRYHLMRPAPSAGAARLADWNWDAAQGRERAWDTLRDRAAPYPYIWSTAAARSIDDATEWIYAVR